MNRLPDWDIRLVQMVPEELAKPFDWASATCGHLIASSVIACYGPKHPVLKELKGLTSRTRVLSLLDKRGGLSAILADYFELLPTNLYAQDGDIGVVVGNGVEAGGVILSRAFVGRDESRPGGFRIPTPTVTKVFRV